MSHYGGLKKTECELSKNKEIGRINERKTGEEANWLEKAAYTQETEIKVNVDL